MVLACCSDPRVVERAMATPAAPLHPLAFIASGLLLVRMRIDRRPVLKAVLIA